MRNFLLLALLAISSLVWAQSGPPTVTFQPAAPVSVAPGHTGHVILVFRVGDGFHINSHKPLDQLLLPTEVKLSPPTDIMISQIGYPQGQLVSFPFSPEAKLSVYSGEFRVSAAVRPSQDSATGTFRVHGDLRFQACNDRQCFPPRKIPLEFDVKIHRSKKSRRG
jgi:hypothetical protein